MKENFVLYLDSEVTSALRKIAFMIDSSLQEIIAEILESEWDQQHKQHQPPE